nr:hypothetical protein Hi04_10k_c5801_00029 [uncultured bacterium]
MHRFGATLAFAVNGGEDNQSPMPTSMMRLLLIVVLTTMLTACPGRVLNAATKRVADGLAKAVLNENDLATARDGLPSYLLVVDGLIISSPDNADLLSAGARLYSTYATNFVTDPERAQRLSEKARTYAKQRLCIDVEDLCNKLEKPLDEFDKSLSKTDAEDVPALYGYGEAWASWIQTHSGDWSAIADLPKVKAIMQRVVELNENYEHGNAHLYLGVIASQVPQDMGGKPEDGRLEFERAIRLSEGQNLIAKVLYAKYYARLTFDRDLHDRLLHEVLASTAEVDGMVLSNTIAKQQAQTLLKTADDYF